MNILREVWGENELTTLYDNEEAVCGISFNGAAYFFLKNLQGDVIAITDADGDVIARYTYDAWGAGGIASTATANFASKVLFANRVANSGTVVIQLLQKFYEKSKMPMNLQQLKYLITLCQRFGLEIHAKLNDLVNVTNHKSWNGISHIHVGKSRIHVALTKDAVNYIRNILGI